MQKFEQDYSKLVRAVLDVGVEIPGRNGNTLEAFGTSLKINMRDIKVFPLLQGRRMFPKGIIGEFAALLRRPSHVDDFTKWGCNYWDSWAAFDGSLDVDYGNAWVDFDGIDQIAELKHLLATDPHSRRMIVTGWNPRNLADLSLPCCHMLYQFNVQGKYLNMIWTQRSADLMIGVPSDVILAALWLIMLANEFGLKPGVITMNFGSTHIYEEHIDGARHYLDVLKDGVDWTPPKYKLNCKPGKDFLTFEPDDIDLGLYISNAPIKFELKS